MIVSIVIIIAFLVAFILFRKNVVEQYKPSSTIFIPFYKISTPIVEAVFKKKKGIFRNSFLKPQVVDRLKQMNPTDRTNFHIKKFYIEKMALSFLIIFGCSILTLVAILGQSKESVLIDNKYVERKNFGEGDKKEKLVVNIKEEEKEQDVSITISEQLLTEEEVQELFREVKAQLENKILGNNASLMEVRNNLKLISKIEDIPVSISWETSNFEILGTDGEVENYELDEQGVLVDLEATLICQDYTDEYLIQVKVLPPILSEDEKTKKNITDLVKQANEENLTEKYIELPENLNGKTISWSEPEDNSKNMLWLFGILGAVLIYYAKDKDLESKVKKINQQSISDYPDIVSKLTLLLGAGMTVKGAWQKIAFDYREKKQMDSKYYRYAYEEMLISYYEIMSGVSEATAYEEFGKRMRNQRYVKLTSLITQNLKKGSIGLSKVLESESIDAFEDRKAYAKIAGEEAGTKLMIPMFLNLIVVLIIIMIPACMSF